MNLDKLDKIILSQQDVDSLFEWRDNHKDYVRNYKPVLTDGVIEVKGNHKQLFQSRGKFVTIVVFNNNDEIVHTFIWDNVTKLGRTIESRIKQDEKSFNESILSLFTSLMAYMEYYGDKKEYVDVEEVRAVVQKKAKGNSKKKKSPIRIKKKIYKIKVTKESIKLDKNRYERKAEKWTVRGHWRQLKNGKKIWIASHVKGEGKEVTPKEYKL